MHLILLSGNTPLSQDWIDQIQKALQSRFDSTYIQYYLHWTDETVDSFQMPKELERLASQTQSYSEYVVFAKSIGVAMTLTGIDQGFLQPAKCIFAGTPSKTLRQYRETIQSLSFPVLFIQEKNDPYGSFQDICETVSSFQKDSFIAKQIPGDNHHYDHVGELVEEIIQWL